MKLLDKIATKLGYIPLEEYRAEKRRSDFRYNQLGDQLDEAHELNINQIVAEIKKARCTSVVWESDYSLTEIAPNGEVTESPRYQTRPPAASNWYAVTAKVDVGLLNRVNEELLMRGQSREVDYFIDSILYKLKKDIEVAMRLTG